MKKLLALLGVGGLFIMSLTGCPSPTSTPTTTTTTTTTTAKETTKTTTKETTKESATTKDGKEAKTVKGKVVKYADDELTIKDDKDMEHKYKVKDAKLMVDGKEGKWDAVKADQKVTVTEKEGKATEVDVTKGAEKAPESKAIKGKVVKYADDELTVKDDKDMEHKIKVKDAKLMVDGKEGKWDAVKADQKVTVTEKEGKATEVDVTTK